MIYPVRSKEKEFMPNGILLSIPRRTSPIVLQAGVRGAIMISGFASPCCLRCLARLRVIAVAKNSCASSFLVELLLGSGHGMSCPYT
jgi:hypothetical protein